MKIKSLTPTVTYTLLNGTHFLDFGDIKKNSKAIANIEISGVTNITLMKTCGCSTATMQGNIGIIEYKNTHKTEPFSKTIKLNFTEGQEVKNQLIKIKGNVHA